MFQFLEDGAAYFVRLIGLSVDSPFGAALHFFLYDSVKIIILLLLITQLMGLVNHYLPTARIRSFLSKNKLFGLDYVFAAFLGAITPFCSCSSVPLFIGFLRGGLPLGLTFTFLIVSPLVNEIALAYFLAAWGWKFTLFYLFAAMTLAIFAGWSIALFRLDSWLSPWLQEALAKTQAVQQQQFKAGKLNFLAIWQEALGTLKKLLPYILVGIALGAFLHGYTPEGFLENYLPKNSFWSVPLATVLAIPLYNNAAGILPLLEVLIQKGVPLGTAMAFMMATIGLSFPEAMLLKKVMQWRLIILFFSLVALLIILLGFLFNAVAPYLI